ncbi:putative amino acid transporter, transmembrane domain-containing protein [Helianthus annuus]|nr:putative amino acid transporter, transmembrane domain-containing protein [Helianthus annuus]
MHFVYLLKVAPRVNLLCGVALLSTPYAVKQGGWVGLSILFIFCVLSFYTGILLRCCLDSRPGLQTYPDIGEAAFGIIGRLVVSVSLTIFFLTTIPRFSRINAPPLELSQSLDCEYTT